MPKYRHFGTGSDAIQQVYGAGVNSNVMVFLYAGKRAFWRGFHTVQQVYGAGADSDKYYEIVTYWRKKGLKFRHRTAIMGMIV